MKRFFLYCNTDQAYEALTNNDFLCRDLKKSSFQIPTLGFISEKYIFLSGEKLSEKDRSFGVSEMNNQYPVTFEITGIDEYEINARFLIRDEDGTYRLLDEAFPLTQFGEIADCVGAFVFGYIPFSMVSRVIFESEENKRRFFKSGPELWFPEDIYSLWEDEHYADLPKKTIDSYMLREAAKQLDNNVLPEEAEKLYGVIKKRIHSKSAAYMAIEATKNWRANNVRTNFDSAIIKFLDDAFGTIKSLAEKRIEYLTDIFSFVDRREFFEKDEALEDTYSNGSRIFQAIIKSIEKNEYVLDKTTVSLIKEELGDFYFSENMFETSAVATIIDSISTFTSSKLADSEHMLEVARPNDVLYALALCVKNKGDLRKLVEEQAEMSQRVRRYALIIDGFVADVGMLSGEIKSNRVLDKHIGNKMASRFDDPSNRLLRPKAIEKEACGFNPQAYISIKGPEFRDSIMQSDEDCLETLYHREFEDAIPFEEISSFKNPIRIDMDGDIYIITSIKKYEEFLKAINKKIKPRKKEFNKEMFLDKILNELKPRLVSVFEKYRSNTMR